jgi:hypothetical protein
VPPDLRSIRPFEHAFSAPQRTSQRSVALHWMPFEHEVPSAVTSPHRTEQRAELQAIGPFAHAPAPRHVRSHVPASQVIPAAHEELPLQATRQLDPLHARTLFLQASAPTQSMLQPLAREQSTPARHAPEPLHCTSHGTPGGQTIFWFPQAGPGQENVHVPASQVPASQTSAQFTGDASALTDGGS